MPAFSTHRMMLLLLLLLQADSKYAVLGFRGREFFHGQVQGERTETHQTDEVSDLTTTGSHLRLSHEDGGMLMQSRRVIEEVDRSKMAQKPNKKAYDRYRCSRKRRVRRGSDPIHNKS
ncbi:PREDICTED: CLAVATA3/ESR (CLE)-related protein 45-like [Tarenaya hassleriana]|uniref:CLAVATA3/ESR (CLE)-related protein 45-like n=1 Tax=Tarenaya hassleriana TaxID=28532 RepID=UPI00053C66AD|nr:PREDICTED: CLAVATA3/ESR (CLE)-related protein 45-like [Tarenaya hassleriana]